jgi:hypothetical protein
MHNSCHWGDSGNDHTLGPVLVHKRGSLGVTPCRRTSARTAARAIIDNARVLDIVVLPMNRVTRVAARVNIRAMRLDAAQHALNADEQHHKRQ